MKVREMGTLRLDMQFVLLLLTLWGAQVQCQEEVWGFTAARNDSDFFHIPRQVTGYNHVITNTGEAFDPANDRSNPAGQGVYYVSLTAGNYGDTRFKLSLARNNAPDIPLVSLANTESGRDGIDTAHRGVFAQLEGTPSPMLVMAAPGSEVYSDPQSLTTSWTMFKAERLSRIPITWSVARSTGCCDSEADGYPMSFDKVNTNIGDMFVNETASLVVSTSGFYFMHLSGATAPEKEFAFTVRCLPPSGDPPSILLINGLSRSDNTSKGLDISSRSSISYLKEGQVCQVYNYPNSALESNAEGWHISWSGFGYALNDTADAVAFFAFRVRDWEVEEEATLTYDYTDVNLRDGFDGTTGTFTCPTGMSGLYFVSWSAGAMEGTGVHVQLMHNGQPVATLMRTMVDHNGHDTLSRDMMLTLTEGDTLSLMSAGPLYSQQFRQTSFAALRLFTVPEKL